MIELRVQKQTHTSMASLFLTKISSPFNGERIDSLRSGAGTTGYSHVKGWGWTPILHHLEKWTGNGSMTYNS